MKRTILAAILSMALCGTAFAASSVTLAWDSVADVDVAGYKVYQGTTTGAYTTTPCNVKVPITTCTIAAIPDGTYFWAATAYDKYGNESDFSNEVSAQLKKPGTPGNLVILKATTVPGAK